MGMGGDLHATSQLGLGSSFVMDLPFAVLPSQHIVSQPAVAERRVLGVAPDQPQRRVLVVDDHAPSRRLLVSQLAALNTPAGQRPVLDVREAGSAGEALAAWDSWRPDLILLDMRLPDRNGSQVAAEVRQRVPVEGGVVIVGLSASVLEEDRAEFLGAGCDSFIGKPYREREILAVLAQYLGVRFLYEEGTAGG